MIEIIPGVKIEAPAPAVTIEDPLAEATKILKKVKNTVVGPFKDSENGL